MLYTMKNNLPNITAGLESSLMNLAILAESVALAPETSPWASRNEFVLLVDGRFDFFALALSDDFPGDRPSPCTITTLPVTVHPLYMWKEIELIACTS
jgi:hypothetical protein